MSRLTLIFTLSFLFVTVLAFLQGLWWVVVIRRRARDQEIARRLGIFEQQGAQQEGLLRSESRDPWARQLGSAGAWLQSINLQAGRPTTIRSLLTRTVVLALCGAVPLVILIGPLGVVGAVLGGIPIVLLMRQGEARSARISEQLPDALDLISRSLQAGYGLSEALRVCATESPIPLAQEFGRTYEEHNLGREFRASLENMVRRNPKNFDLRIFTAAVLLQRETGGNLVEIVSNIATTIRARFTLQAKIRSLTSEARLSSYILGSLPIGVTVLIAVVRGDYLTPLVSDPLGRVLLLYALCSYGFGILVMRALSEVET
ncbi:MAG: type II secretion system F family protein [Pseudomonadota bacterium]